MASDPEVIVQVRQADEEFQNLMAYVRGPESRSATAFEAELHVFRALMALGVQLLAVFFAVRSQASAAEQAPAVPHSWRSTTYLSVFGRLSVRRAYYWNKATGGTCPLDETLSPPARRYSDLLRDWLEFALTSEAYDQAVAFLERILGFSLAKHALERLAAEDAADVAAFYDQKPPPPVEEEASILVVQVDGKGVRMVKDEDGIRRTEKKEAVVSGIYTIASHRADPAAIADTLAGNDVDTANVAPKEPRPEPVAKQLRATLAGKDVAFDRLTHAVQGRDGPHVQHRVALSDGAPALQERVGSFLPGFTLILDIVHVKDYVRDASVALLGADDPLLGDFISCRLLEILTGRLERVLVIFEDRIHRTRDLSATEEKVVATAIGYLRNTADYMNYDHYLALGWPIATGVAEGGCGHLVKHRMEGPGMKWRPSGAQAVLDLRSVRVNGDWDAYQQFRRDRAHCSRYGSTTGHRQPVELEALALAA